MVISATDGLPVPLAQTIGLRPEEAEEVVPGGTEGAHLSAAFFMTKTWQADPITRTFRVRVGLINPPPAMFLGATVKGRMELESTPGIALPASALTRIEGQPAVWLVDPKTMTVALHNVQIERFDPATVLVSHGLDGGEIVVTAGVQVLHPGQKVRLLGASP